MLSEMRDKYCIMPFTSGIGKIIQKNLYTKQTHRFRTQTYDYQQKRLGSVNLQYESNRHKTTIYEIDKQIGFTEISQGITPNIL